MKLTTDRHEASRGLFATAELLVFHTFVLYFSKTSSGYRTAVFVVSVEF